jgi:MFS family permease
MGAGSLVGSLGLAFAARRPMLRLMLGGAVSFVIFELLLGLTGVAAVAYALIFVIGLSSMVMVNTINVMVQNSVPDEMRGRVMALYVTVFAGSAPIGGFFAGAVAEVWQAPAGFVLGALLSVGAIALVTWQLVLRDAGWSARASTHVHDPADEPQRRAAGQ